MSLLKFVKNLPENLVYAPIYRKGVEMRSKEGKLTKSTGKNPYGEAYERTFRPADVIHFLEKYPEKFGSIGLFTGIRGAGLVILDVDTNLSALKKKWGDSLEGAIEVRSTKKNAAKYVFKVPEELWGDVKGRFLSQETSTCYEILWGRQGLIYGAYPGSKTSQEGAYTFEGDLNNIPVAPDWLIAEMKALKAGETKESFVKNRKGLDLTDRTEDEIAQIVQECLSVLTHQGAGSRDHWLKIGMAIHSELPNDLGLTLWSAWSSEDPDYADHWDNGNPCEDVWKSFKRKGVGLGSLIFWADKADPKRLRFSPVSREIVEKAEAKQIVDTRLAIPDFDEFYERADKIFLAKHDSVGKRRYQLNRLANDAGIRVKGAQEITEMYLSEREKRMGKVKQRTAEERFENPAKAHYYVPGIFCAGVWVLSGEGGSGKTNTAWAFARKFMAGESLDTPDGTRSTEKGNVIWLSGDQMDASIDDQLVTHLKKEHTKSLYIENNFNINDYPSFISLVNEHTPKLVVIDSLRSCHRGTSTSENDSEFALPLRWYEQMMGDMFPNCMILILHHSGKGGSGPRGTSAIKDMCSFSMNFEVPSAKSPYNPLTTRVITFKKHRFGLTNHQITASMKDDDTIRLMYQGAVDAECKGASVQDRVRIALTKDIKKPWTVEDLSQDQFVSGSKEAVRKALQRLDREGLAKRIGGKDGGRGKTNQWIASGIGPLYKSFISSQYPKSIGTTKKISENPVVPTPDLSQLNEVEEKIDQVSQLNQAEMRQELIDLANEWKK